ncbi:MAG: NERD domain-containing protein kinase family protein [Pseudomonadota bacterium]|nr:NERD domain-containing protein kinase family protein [Pseudomonadota bacterium]MDP1572899.1 NERD domain-containing protein kinase family protein [Pseudomonadota bacterium]MDP1906135.1 NERD domain-containing protein kinase family protein [Pseudomonadota bacterium]
MAAAGFRHIPCGAAVNASEALAIEKLKNKLQGISGPWVLLSNLSHSSHASRLSDEIDQVVIGPPGVFVVEVKHWDAAWLKQNPQTVDNEADRINDKAKRIAGKLKTAFDPGFVAPRLLLTRGGTGMQVGQRIKHRGVPVFGLGEWRELVEADAAVQLTSEQIERAALVLEPSARASLTGDLRSFAGLINLERIPTLDAPFHRVYRGQHPTRRDKVVLHLYDLSAADGKDAENRAKREYEVMQHWQKSPYLPSLLDSFQEAERYPGELYWFSMVDPAAPTLAERAQDAHWSLDDRLRYAREALSALAGFHQPVEAGLPCLVHRRITPQTLRVRHNGRPLFTDFSVARLDQALTISLAPEDFGEDTPYVAPEVRQGGLAAADARSDIYALCASLMPLFAGDEARAREARQFLEQGCAQNPEGRESLADLAAVLERNTAPIAQAQPELPAPEYWDEDTVVPFQNAKYKIVSRLGRGGIGQTFKVVEVDASSDERYGTYVAKLIHHEADAEPALRAYRKARAYTVHPHLSAIHEIAPDWRADRFVALLKWVEGMPLADLAGVLALHAEELGETSLQDLVLRWLRDLCDALWALHQVGLVHGDVSPRNLIVQGGEVVLTDYDTVTNAGSAARSRNPLYASYSVESGAAIQASDDLFALAASFFHVLFEREPFNFAGQRIKNRGLNWEGLESAGLERVVEFLNRATSTIEANRFTDARVALAFLAPTPSGTVEPRLPAPTYSENTAPRLAELLSAYPGSRHGNSETRGLDSTFAADTYVETRLDHVLRQELEQDKVKLAILFGNAGDGKTAFLQHLLAGLGLSDVHSSQRVQAHRLADERQLTVNLDGSAAWQGQSANTLLDQFFLPCHDLVFDGAASNPRVLAINSGKLLEWLETQDDSPLTRQLYGVLFETDDEDEPVLDSRIRLIDLNRRSLVGGIQAGEIRVDFLTALLDRFLGVGLKQDPWAGCATCMAQHRCTAWHSVQTLRAPDIGMRLRARLADALQACHLRGEAHITARELRAALVFLFFGVHDCGELHANPELMPPRYWDRAFAADASQRQGELLAELARFDPALDSNPLLDRHLLRETPHGPDDIAAALASARRRAWFEWDDARYTALQLPADALPLFGGRHLDRFRRVPLMNEDEREALCRELCLGVARLEDLPEAAFAREIGLPLRIQPRTPTESAFWVVKLWERFHLEAPLPRTAEGLEALHTHLLLIYRYAAGGEERLPVGLELFHLLLALKDGAQLAGAGQEGVFAHLEIFTQRLAQEDARELHGWHPGDEASVFRVRVEARDGRQILVREAA